MMMMMMMMTENRAGLKNGSNQEELDYSELKYLFVPLVIFPSWYTIAGVVIIIECICKWYT